MTRSIIFDFDGVIINSHDLQVKALKESYQTICGEGEPPYHEFFKNCGDSLKNIFVKLNLPLSMIPIYQKISKENIQMISVHQGMIELIQELKGNKYRCALCTGKDRERTLKIVKQFKLGQLLDAIICSDDVDNPKPHQESLLLAMQLMDSSMEETIMVGDGVNDILCAKNASIQSLAVTWGDTSKEDLAKTDPSALVDTVQQLHMEILKRFSNKKGNQNEKNKCRFKF